MSVLYYLAQWIPMQMCIPVYLLEKQGSLAKAAILSPREVAKVILDESSLNQALIIPGLVNKFYWFLMKIIPLGLGVPFLSDIYRQELPNPSEVVTINK